MATGPPPDTSTRFSRAEPGRFADRATEAVRDGDQPQDREGAWPDDPTVGVAAGRSGHQVIDRRAFLTAVGVAVAAVPFVSEAQQVRNRPVVGVLMGGSESGSQSRL